MTLDPLKDERQEFERWADTFIRTPGAPIFDIAKLCWECWQAAWTAAAVSLVTDIIRNRKNGTEPWRPALSETLPEPQEKP